MQKVSWDESFGCESCEWILLMPHLEGSEEFPLQVYKRFTPRHLRHMQPNGELGGMPTA